jgi:hypothetical protein
VVSMVRVSEIEPSFWNFVRARSTDIAHRFSFKREVDYY